MIGTALVDHRPKRIDLAVGTEHLLVVPVENELCTLCADCGILRADVVLLMRILGKMEQHLPREKTEAVVIGTDIQPVAETGGTLADMGHLREDQAFPAAGASGANGFRIAFAVPVVRFIYAEQLRERREKIEAVMQAVV